MFSSPRGTKSLCVSVHLPVFQRSSRAAAVTLGSLPMAGGKALGSVTATRSRLSASLPLSWWGRRPSRAKRITSGRLRSQAACVSELGGGPLPSGHPEAEVPVLWKPRGSYHGSHSSWFLQVCRSLLPGSLMQTVALKIAALDTWGPSPLPSHPPQWSFTER